MPSNIAIADAADLLARIEALEKRVEALEGRLGAGKPCLFETRRDPHYASHSVAYCVVHHSYDCQSNTDQ